jgi:hypothetical protein
MVSKLDLSTKTARKELSDLLEQREHVWSQMHDASGNLVQLDFYSSQAIQLDKRIRELQEFYNANLLESLESESRKLKWLTVALIVLTATLTFLTALLVYRTFI